jgi:hypothetical protein
LAAGVRRAARAKRHFPFRALRARRLPRAKRGLVFALSTQGACARRVSVFVSVGTDAAAAINPHAPCLAWITFFTTILRCSSCALVVPANITVKTFRLAKCVLELTFRTILARQMFGRIGCRVVIESTQRTCGATLRAQIRVLAQTACATVVRRIVLGWIVASVS